MARPRKKLDTHGQAHEVLRMFNKEKSGWRKDRLRVIKLGLEGELSKSEIASVAGCHLDTVNNWFNLFREGGA